jgi:hypothetical protein
MTTPISVLTNLAYVAAGLYVLRDYHVPADWSYKKPHVGPGLSGWLVGLSFIALGIASGLYHGFYSPWAQLMDERGMYLVFGVLAGVVWAKWAAGVPTDTMRRMVVKYARETPDDDFSAWRGAMIVLFPWLGLDLGLVLAAFAAEPWVDSRYVMPALAILCILGVGVGQSWARALKFLVAFAAIAAIRELPEATFWARDPLFDYDAIHGIWHLVTAPWMIYLYKSTEG